MPNYKEQGHFVMVQMLQAACLTHQPRQKHEKYKSSLAQGLRFAFNKAQ